MAKEEKDDKAKMDIDKFIGTPDELEFLGMTDDIEMLKQDITIKSSVMGPQYKNDPPFTARMRFYQSWYRANVLGVGWGTGPGPSETRELGNMLTRESGAKGLNFLTPEIFELVKNRLKDASGMVDEYRLLHNMLSSQPMCFNLFGPLVVNYDLAARVFEQLLGSEIEKVLDVRIEYAPEPACEYLDDRTAFDAFVKFVLSDGTNGFVGIETKLTEPFSKKHYDTPAYRRWSEQEYSPWPKKAWPYLADIRHNQLWRDHLLAVAMQHHLQSFYTTGFLMLVRHPADTQCAEAVDVYRKFLKPEDKSFLDYPLDKLVDKIELSLENVSAKNWLNEFRKRYLNLALSEDEWIRRTAG